MPVPRRGRPPGLGTRRWWAVTLACGLLALGLVAERLQGAGGEVSSHRVAWVVDGDTVELHGGTRVRYLGVDAPELRRRVGERWVEAPEPWSREAHALNESLVRDQWVDLEHDAQQEDGYGRELAYVFTRNAPPAEPEVPRQFVNAALLDAGVAFVSVVSPNTHYLDDLLRAQDGAKTARRGLWAELDTTPLSPALAGTAIGAIAPVEGRVRRVARRRGVLALEFQDAGRTGFTAIIRRSELASFSARRIDPVAAYADRRVRVYGLIEARPGLEMVVHSPAQVDLIE